MRRSLAVVLIAFACGRGSSDLVAVDGSSTVFPISEAVAEEFSREQKTRVTVGASGTGGGFRKFCSGEIAITGASRPIKPEEVEMCAKRSVAYIELPVAYDGLAVVVNPANTWVDQMTVADLAKLWAPDAQDEVETWNDIRAEWPAEEIHLFGAGVDSGTYDYFTQAIVGKEHSSRGDYTSSEDDNVLVHGIASDRLALGFFGFAYYRENATNLKLVPIDDGKPDNGSGPILPSPQSVRDGTYQPLSRPVFIYVAETACARPEVAAFVAFYLDRGPALVEEVGYIPLPDSAYELVRARFRDRIVGSVFGGGGSRVGVSVDELLQAG
jgi:phosphate transport system substrate-binding protein